MDLLADMVYSFILHTNSTLLGPRYCFVQMSVETDGILLHLRLY